MPTQSDKKPFRDRSKDYRRGLVLGFSMAEIFLILLFLLLLTMASYSSVVEEKIDLLTQNLAQNQESIFELSNANAELSILASRRGSPIDLSKEIVLAKVELKKTKNTLQNALDNNNDLFQQLQNQQQQAALSNEIILAAQTISEKIDQNNIVQWIGSVDDQLNDLSTDLSFARSETQKVRDKLYVLSKKTGIDNFCWYKEVVTNDGALRERGIKTFDMRIWNNQIEVIYPTPPTVFANSVNELPIDLSTVNGFYSDTAFREKFKDLYEYGIAGKVYKQPAECHFQVWVWDNTGKRNKRGFKQKMRIVESYFFKLNVIAEPWPHN